MSTLLKPGNPLGRLDNVGSEGKALSTSGSGGSPLLNSETVGTEMLIFWFPDALTPGPDT
ncbi:MAG: hypothetical protein KGJ12_06285 [Gammaproteobacteria bacterium]|nr:hypothetical protein [Gammaproteobacteria bacterium]